MGALGDMASKAVDAVTGKKRGTTLNEFLAKFSSAEGTYVNTIDPVHTFDVEFKFYPNSLETVPGLLVEVAKTCNSSENKEEDKKESSLLEKLGSSILESAKSAANNIANNLTGGLLGSIMNSKKQISTEKENFTTAGKTTFLEYLAEANLLTSKDNYLSQALGSDKGSSASPLILNLGFYIQSITVPQLRLDDGGVSETLLGKFNLNGKAVVPDSNTVIMSVINTKVPLLDRIFYPWMQEIRLPFWSYETCPYTTATITIDMTKHSDIKYVFYGCRPTNIQTEQPTQEVDSTITRDVTFTFDFMSVQSEHHICEDYKDKLLSSAKALAGSAGSMIGL